MPPSSATGASRQAAIGPVAGACIGLAILGLTLSPATGKETEKARSNAASPPIQSPPLPPPRPDRIPETPAAPQGKETAKPESNGDAKSEPVAAPKGPSSHDPTPCLDRLAKLGVTMEPMPPIAAGACGAEHPFRMTKLPDGVAAAPAAQVGCPVAEALARWVLEVVEPEAEKHLKLVPKKVLIGTSYECRGQNRDGAAKLSEHAFANAVDLMGFAFAKRAPYTVGFPPAGSPEAAFQSAIQKGACAHFTTVLGPGSDAAHGDHLHLDLRARKGGYRICQ